MKYNKYERDNLMKMSSACPAKMTILFAKCQRPNDAIHQKRYDGSPNDEPAGQVEQIAVQYVGTVPRVAEHLLQVDFLAAVGTGLFFAHHAPATNAKLVKFVIARKAARFLDGLESVAAHGA